MQILTEKSKMSSNFLVDETSENLTCHSRENGNLRIIMILQDQSYDHKIISRISLPFPQNQFANYHILKRYCKFNKI